MIYYNCDKCELSRSINYIAREYDLSNGKYIPLFQRHVWCSKCQTITPAESLEESDSSKKVRKEFVEEHREKLRTRVFDYDFEEELLHKWICDYEEHERNYKEWRSLRRSKPHCLVCGNEEIDIPSEEYCDIEHKGCGGNLICTMTIGSAVGHRLTPHRYSIEGQLLEQGYTQSQFEGEPRKPLSLWWEDKI